MLPRAFVLPNLFHKRRFPHPVHNVLLADRVFILEDTKERKARLKDTTDLEEAIRLRNEMADISQSVRAHIDGSVVFTFRNGWTIRQKA